MNAIVKLAAAAALLCSVDAQANETPNAALPDDYKKVVETAVKATLKDPMSAVIKIGDPYKQNCERGLESIPLWGVPVDYNAKNAYGAFVGFQHIVFWYSGKEQPKVTGGDCPN